MECINLIDKLSEEDKKTIENYIYTNGIRKDKFIGLEEWLSSWSHANQKLYALLGNQLIVKIPIEYYKNEEVIIRECEALFKNSTFIKAYKDFYYHTVSISGNLSTDADHGLYELCFCRSLIEGATRFPIRIEKTATKKLLQIPKGTKIMRAYSKIADYFDLDKNDFEKFRIAHSMITADKAIKTNLCLSIHPMDFMTMSDNASDWSSCMSWSDEGCYRIGTVEMMNSNNVLCCYLEGSHDYCFNINMKENNRWNNKTYRILCYITKDILMSGKSYPYKNEDLAKLILQKVKGMAEDHLHWTYQYGPELYQDMKYINSTYTMDRARHYMKYAPVKKNILWDTKGMYNDMLNDHGTNYWCYRNKVKKTKVLSVSGKNHCLCCNNSVTEEEWSDDYNERYSNAKSLICYSCMDNIAERCDICGEKSYTEENFTITVQDRKEVKKICKSCLKKTSFICPCCGRPFLTNTYINTHPLYLNINRNKKFNSNQTYNIRQLQINFLDGDESNSYVEDCIKAHDILLERLYCCQSCFKKKTIGRHPIKFETYYNNGMNRYVINDAEEKEEFQNYRWKNLRHCDKKTTVFY